MNHRRRAWIYEGDHEYELAYEWDPVLPVLTFVLANPASGEGTGPDITTARCIGYAEREGCGGIWLVNLFTYRATHPADLFASDEPVGPKADQHLAAAFAAAGGRAVVGWGCHPGPGAAERIAKVRQLADAAGCALLCVRLNQDGSPGHPSRGAYGTLQPWPGGSLGPAF